MPSFAPDKPFPPTPDADKRAALAMRIITNGLSYAQVDIWGEMQLADSPEAAARQMMTKLGQLRLELVDQVSRLVLGTAPALTEDELRKMRDQEVARAEEDARILAHADEIEARLREISKPKHPPDEGGGRILPWRSPK